MGTFTNIGTIKSDVSLFGDGTTRLGTSQKRALEKQRCKTMFLQLGEESLNILNSPITTYLKRLFAIIRSLWKYLKFIALSKCTYFNQIYIQSHLIASMMQRQ